MNYFHPMMQDVEQGYNSMSDSQIATVTRRFSLAVVFSFISIGIMNALV